VQMVQRSVFIMAASIYLQNRFCSWCGLKCGLHDYRCPNCNRQTRGSNVRTGSVRKEWILGIRGVSP